MLLKPISSSFVYYAKDINVRGGVIMRDRSQSDVKRMTAQETRCTYVLYYYYYYYYGYAYYFKENNNIKHVNNRYSAPLPPVTVVCTLVCVVHIVYNMTANKCHSVRR